MITRATARAALEAHHRTAAAGREYGAPINAAMALTGELGEEDFLSLGLLWLVVANASRRQLEAAWHYTGLDDELKRGPVSRHLRAALRGGADALPPETGDIAIVRLALACFDQGDMFTRVTPARLVEVLTWDELQRDPGAAP